MKDKKQKVFESLDRAMLVYCTRYHFKCWLDKYPTLEDYLLQFTSAEQILKWKVDRGWPQQMSAVWLEG